MIHAAVKMSSYCHFSFSFFSFFSIFRSLCTSYQLYTIRITHNCDNGIVIPSCNFNVAIIEIKRSPFIFLYFFLTSTRGHFIILSFLIMPVALDTWVAMIHINEQLKKKLSKKYFRLLQISKAFLTTRVQKVHYYRDLSFLDKSRFYKGLLLHWLIPITCIRNELALHV